MPHASCRKLLQPMSCWRLPELISVHPHGQGWKMLIDFLLARRCLGLPGRTASDVPTLLPCAPKHLFSNVLLLCQSSVSIIGILSLRPRGS